MWAFISSASSRAHAPAPVFPLSGSDLPPRENQPSCQIRAAATGGSERAAANPFLGSRSLPRARRRANRNCSRDGNTGMPGLFYLGPRLLRPPAYSTRPLIIPDAKLNVVIFSRPTWLFCRLIDAAHFPPRRAARLRCTCAEIVISFLTQRSSAVRRFL